MMAGVLKVIALVIVLGVPGLAQSYHAFFFDQKSDAAKVFEEQLAAARDTLTGILQFVSGGESDEAIGLAGGTRAALREMIVSVLEISRTRNRNDAKVVAGLQTELQNQRNELAATPELADRTSSIQHAFAIIQLDLETNFSLEEKATIKKHFAEFGQDLPSLDNEDDRGFVTSPFLQAGEGEGDFFSSLRPGTFLGANETVHLSSRKQAADKISFPWKMDIKAGLVFAGGLDVRDSNDYKKALLYPGTMNVLLATNVRIPYLNGRFAKVSLPNLTAGLKFIPGLVDTSETIIQVSVACGAAVQIKSTIMAYGQVIWSRHDLTSESERSFGAAFPAAVKSDHETDTSIRQYFLGLQFSVGTKESQGRYFYLEWRKLASRCKLGQFGDDKFLTFGFRNDITL